jgi:ketosteroid isomerase-like protein
MSYSTEHYLAVLKSFGEAFDRLDAPGLVALMTEDCVFRTAMGDQAGGNAIVGRAAVQAAFEQTFASFPDARWIVRGNNFVNGERGVSEWTFVATRKTDNARFEMDGVDMFTFKDGKIAIKDAFRKDRPPLLAK